MATANLTPIISSIHGRVGGVVFYRRQNKTCVRLHVIPANTDTKNQRNIRSRFALAIKSWQNLTADGKYKYNRKARSLNMSGYNLYISEYMKDKNAPSKTEIYVIQGRGVYTQAIQSRIPSVSYSKKRAIKEISPLLPGQTDPG